MALKSYRTIASAVALILTLGPPASADGTSVTKPQDHMMDMQMMGTGLFLPEMNAAAGRSLFASKAALSAIRSTTSAARTLRHWMPR
jgi:hypothetical protein